MVVELAGAEIAGGKQPASAASRATRSRTIRSARRFISAHLSIQFLCGLLGLKTEKGGEWFRGNKKTRFLEEEAWFLRR
jgi:hypothetical protein